MANKHEEKKQIDAYASLGGQARRDALSPEKRSDIARRAVQARWAKSNTTKFNDSNNLPAVVTAKSNTPDIQLDLLRVEKQIELDGVGMGVLSDGTPYLTGQGLARLCGINAGRMSEMASTWDTVTRAGMVTKVKELLAARGIIMEKPFIEVKQRTGNVYAYPDYLCLAVLEYYAFDAPTTSEDAKKNYRLLAGKALAEFIYTQVGYDPTHSVPDEWKQFHDRISLTYNSVPHGYFGIFKEIADMVVTLGQAGLHIDSKFVPDISVGTRWSKYWTDNKFDATYGQRTKYDHCYPEYFPQAESNPQDAWCYPDAALGEFRKWLREEYILKGALQKYIGQKVRAGELPVSFAQLAITAYGIEDKTEE